MIKKPLDKYERMKKNLDKYERINYERLITSFGEEDDLKQALKSVQIKIQKLAREMKNLRNAKDKLQK